MKDEICINTFVATSTDTTQVPGGNHAVNNGQVHVNCKHLRSFTILRKCDHQWG